METSGGSLRNSSFTEIWRDGAIFKALRAPKLEGRCGACEFQNLCGGCRARPLARSNQLMGEDFLCSYEPQGGAVVEVLKPAEGTLQWSRDATARIARVPGFVRRMVKRRVEADVRLSGRQLVTADDISRLARERFKNGMPPGLKRPPGI